MDLVQLFHHETDLLSVNAGQTLFKRGDQGDLMYVLMSGAAQITVHDKVVETAQAGAIVGEMAMVDELARSATVIAQTDCLFLPIARKRFNFLIQQTPHFALHVMQVMASRLRKTDELL
jgi:CRP/FNR family cyclic AMP-dependent transcriptional regulator